jgi:hypothetical protein
MRQAYRVKSPTIRSVNLLVKSKEKERRAVACLTRGALIRSGAAGVGAAQHRQLTGQFIATADHFIQIVELCGGAAGVAKASFTLKAGQQQAITIGDAGQPMLRPAQRQNQMLAIIDGGAQQLRQLPLPTSGFSYLPCEAIVPQAHHWGGRAPGVGVLSAFRFVFGMFIVGMHDGLLSLGRLHCGKPYLLLCSRAPQASFRPMRQVFPNVSVLSSGKIVQLRNRQKTTRRATF